MGRIRLRPANYFDFCLSAADAIQAADLQVEAALVKSNSPFAVTFATDVIVPFDAGANAVFAAVGIPASDDLTPPGFGG